MIIEQYPNQENPNINPELTQNFIKDSLEKAEKGIYRVEVKIGDKDIPIDVYPEVFPPKSNYSVSSKSVYEAFGNLEGMVIADIGTGTGIESIVAALAGAIHVDAVDINDMAVECTSHNVELNGLSDKITVFRGDLFSVLPNKKYNLIMANLPIVNFKPDNNSGITGALYDPDFILHIRLFKEAKQFLSENGIVTLTHANLQSARTDDPDKDFNDIEKIMIENDYEIVEKVESDALGYKWVNYKIKLII